jgi:phage terminase large subunit GpA-like protein
LTQGIDVRKVALHWVVRAWRPDCTGFTIDYGVQDVHGTTVGSDEGVDMAIVKAIRARWDTITNEPYQSLDGQAMPIEMTMVDAGWKTEAVYHACRELGLGVMPSMGFGKSAGCVQANFSPVARSSYDRKAGDGWFLSRRPGNVWLACLDTDRWKAWEHDRWMTPPNKPGTMMLFGESSSGGRLSFDERSHTAYAHHIVSEVEIEEVVKGVLKRKWKPKSDNNHWLDASYMADVAAAMKGIRLLRSTTPQQDPQSRPSLADLKKHGPERKTIAD